MTSPCNNWLRFNYPQIWHPANLILIILVPLASPACLRTIILDDQGHPVSPHHTKAQHGTVPFPDLRSLETVNTLSKPIWDPPSFPERPFQSYSDHLSYTRKVFTMVTTKEANPTVSSDRHPSEDTMYQKQYLCRPDCTLSLLSTERWPAGDPVDSDRSISSLPRSTHPHECCNRRSDPA